MAACDGAIGVLIAETGGLNAMSVSYTHLDVYKRQRHKLTRKAGEPVIRAAVNGAMKIMGEQFVLGRTINACLLYTSRCV